MTTFTEIEVRCAVCGTLGRKAELSSTSSFGPPDLDLRPNGPSPLGARVPGAALRRVRVLRTVDRRRAARRRRRGRVACLPRRARRVAAAAAGTVVLLRGARERARRDGRRVRAGGSSTPRGRATTRHARAQARVCRERAAEMFVRALELGEAETPPEVLHTVTADVWRRAGRFDDALAACDCRRRRALRGGRGRGGRHWRRRRLHPGARRGNDEAEQRRGVRQRGLITTWPSRSSSRDPRGGARPGSKGACHEPAPAGEKARSVVPRDAPTIRRVRGRPSPHGAAARAPARRGDHRGRARRARRPRVLAWRRVRVAHR